MDILQLVDRLEEHLLVRRHDEVGTAVRLDRYGAQDFGQREAAADEV